MVVIDTQTSANTIYVPKNMAPSGTTLVLSLISTVNNKVYSAIVEDMSGLTDFYLFEVDFSELPDGEYKYEIRDNLQIVSTGLVKIGDFTIDKEEYNYRQEYYEYEG